MPRHNNFSRIHATLWWFLVYFLYHCPATLRYQLVDATFDHVMVTYMLTYVYAWLWRRRCRQTLWKGLADLCHRYAKKNWSGPVTRKTCAKSWNSCRKWDLQGNPSSGFETFSNIDSMWNCSKPSVFFYHCQRRHQSKMAINARHLWGAGIMFVLDFRWTPPLSTPVEILRRPCRDLSPSSRRRAPVRQRHGESGRSSKDWNPMEITSD